MNAQEATKENNKNLLDLKCNADHFSVTSGLDFFAKGRGTGRVGEDLEHKVRHYRNEEICYGASFIHQNFNLQDLIEIP